MNTIASLIQHLNTNGLDAYALRAPQGARYPYCIVKKVTAEEQIDLGSTPDGLENSEIDIDCFGTTYGEANSLSIDIRNMIHGLRGEIGGETLTDIRHCRRSSYTEGVEPRAGGSSDAFVYRCTSGYTIWASSPVV